MSRLWDSGLTRRGLVLQVLRLAGIWVLLVVALPAPAFAGTQRVLVDGIYRVVDGPAHHDAWGEQPARCEEPSVAAAPAPGIAEIEGNSWGRYVEWAIDGYRAFASDSSDRDSTPNGTLAVVPGSRRRSGPGKLLTFRVEVEEGLDMDPACFGLAVESTLWDPRSWGGTGEIAFARVDGPRYDVRIILASPDTTDDLCRPLRTGGTLSCRRGDRIIVNFWRWQNGAGAFNGDLTGYRHYLINHEFGHALGRGHRSCPGPDRLAPVMMQQTKGVASCLPNGWPLGAELR